MSESVVIRFVLLNSKLDSDNSSIISMCNNCKSKKEVLILEQIIDIRRLRQDIYDYFGTGAFAVSHPLSFSASRFEEV